MEREKWGKIRQALLLLRHMICHDSWFPSLMLGRLALQQNLMKGFGGTVPGTLRDYLRTAGLWKVSDKKRCHLLGKRALPEKVDHD